MAGRQSALAREAEALGVEVDRGVDPEEVARLTGRPSGPAKPDRQAARVAAPVIATAPSPPEPADLGDDLVPVRDAETELMLPRIKGARVIYIGGSKRKSIPLKGGMVLEQWEIEPEERDATGKVIKPAKMEREETPDMENGIYSYDFTTHDSRGKLILDGYRLIQPGDPSLKRDPRLRYKGMARVEHPEHLRIFHRMRDSNGDSEFLVEVPRREQARFNRWVEERERRLGREQALIEYTSKD